MTISDLDFSEDLSFKDSKSQQLQGGTVEAQVFVYASANFKGNLIAFGFAKTGAFSGSFKYGS